ncbi:MULTISPECIES: hypothetical protein [unclassified Marinobacter]|jgi:hypothetical protein|uniref:hypothetical protein n=1 Tax=unclassified Marinobacter TaxID=83889 RepID=UPI000948E002|nr:MULTISPECIES: hypothetical protein [unclassified Marinobacter]OLF82701.1 hypothetical protein AWH63_06765 [Marinobacter sp. C18]|tara:strand:+ start:123 stop:545 length:423 start_codon:yes stop_codon:yes gene_type:complete
MTDFTKLPRNIADCMKRAGTPLSDDQLMLLVGYLAPVQQELQQAEARCAELESENESLWETFVKVSDYLGVDNEAARKIPGKPSQVFISAIIRKQAEAVEQAALCFGGRDFADVRLGLSEQAQQLRQQADELEKGGEGCQ